mmetsp:Transcript_116026/g.323160  ORF Transcript_116026/g.323160 Transcript_116026/m.323160 type:complete len:222 (-) Transcript_116026:407-1072(-)
MHLHCDCGLSEVCDLVPSTTYAGQVRGVLAAGPLGNDVRICVAQEGLARVGPAGSRRRQARATPARRALLAAGCHVVVCCAAAAPWRRHGRCSGSATRNFVASVGVTRGVIIPTFPLGGSAGFAWHGLPCSCCLVQHGQRQHGIARRSSTPRAARGRCGFQHRICSDVHLAVAGAYQPWGALVGGRAREHCRGGLGACARGVGRCMGHRPGLGDGVQGPSW